MTDTKTSEVDTTVTTEATETAAVSKNEENTTETTATSTTEVAAAQKGGSPSGKNKSVSAAKSTTHLFDELEPRVTLSARRKNSFYLQRARRLLRLYDEIKILGGNNDISRACLIVELLRKEETGTIGSMETRMQLTAINSRGDFGRPVPVIEFVVKRGNYGSFVSGFAQRKMIELFEKQIGNPNDDENNEEKNNNDNYRLNAEKETYELSEACIRSIGLESSFYATEEKILEANEFLNDASGKNNGYLSLPQFIQYASLLINPKLKNLEFRKILKEKYDLNVGKYGMNDRGHGHDADDAHSNASAEEDEDEEHEEDSKNKVEDVDMVNDDIRELEADDNVNDAEADAEDIE